MGAVFRPLCAAAALAGRRARGCPPAPAGHRDEDPQVLSLVALHCALPPDPDHLRTGECVGHCTLRNPWGGGMGVVYRAQQHLGTATRPVAVKLIHPAPAADGPGGGSTRFGTRSARW